MVRLGRQEVIRSEVTTPAAEIRAMEIGQGEPVCRSYAGGHEDFGRCLCILEGWAYQFRRHRRLWETWFLGEQRVLGRNTPTR
jgi:hypothetical protein